MSDHNATKRPQGIGIILCGLNFWKKGGVGEIKIKGAISSLNLIQLLAAFFLPLAFGHNAESRTYLESHQVSALDGFSFCMARCDNTKPVFYTPI